LLQSTWFTQRESPTAPPTPNSDLLQSAWFTRNNPPTSSITKNFANLWFTPTPPPTPPPNDPQTKTFTNSWFSKEVSSSRLTSPPTKKPNHSKLWFLRK